MQVQQENRPAPHWDLEETKRIVLSLLEQRKANVYLYGSAAENRMTRHSDIDVAIEPLEPLPEDLLPRIREELEQSNIIYNVDLLDLAEAPEALKARVLAKGQLWKG